MVRKKKRTAGQRRYIALRRKTSAAVSALQTVRSNMHYANESGKIYSQLRIMQSITEAIERLD